MKVTQVSLTQRPQAATLLPKAPLNIIPLNRHLSKQFVIPKELADYFAMLKSQAEANGQPLLNGKHIQGN